jgi:aminodeoxyfutalosine synthase
VGRVLKTLRDAGLDGIHELPLDTVGDPDRMVEQLERAGFGAIRLTNAASGGAAGLALWERAAALQQQYGCIRAIAPLASSLRAFRPTTGYDDVKAVALARLAASNVATIQVDWTRYGPKLAQVALTFGADDVWGVSAADAAPEGRRRAPVEEIRRNIEAAGFVPVERDGQFTAVS